MQIKSETTVGMLVLGGIVIFLYMGFKIGSFRFDSSRYNTYTMNFKDISGLNRKAEVKIAGVKVGWVEDISLLANGTMEAQASVRILNEFTLRQDAHATVRQEGLLGPKYLEVTVGSNTLPPLLSGGVLGSPKDAPVSIDELMQRFNHIASNVEVITDSFKSVMGGAQGEENLHQIFDNLNKMSQSLAHFSDIIERSFARNEDNLDSILQIGEQVKRIADQLDHNVLPAVKDSIEKIASVFDRDFDRVATQLTATAHALEDASIQARDGFSGITSISTKIDEGKGLIGKLVNEDETYQDLKVAVQGLKNYFAKVDMLELIFDLHGESMQRPGDNWRHEDSKFFVDMKIYPNEDHFYVVQFASSERGYKDEVLNLRDYSTTANDLVNTDNLLLRDRDRLEFTYNRTDTFWRRNQTRFGLQFGKIFKDIAFRVGLIEGFGGIAVDFDIPLGTERFRWVTSLEAYDLTGWNHYESKRYSNVWIDDRRPHLKWLNKMYILKNLYVVFGADDFVSKHNATAFFGAGLRFGDDDIKYLLPTMGGGRSLKS